MYEVVSLGIKDVVLLVSKEGEVKYGRNNDLGRVRIERFALKPEIKGKSK